MSMVIAESVGQAMWVWVVLFLAACIWAEVAGGRAHHSNSTPAPFETTGPSAEDQKRPGVYTLRMRGEGVKQPKKNPQCR